MRPSLLLSTIVAVLCGAVLVATVHQGHAAFNFFGGHKNVRDMDGMISIPISDVDDGKAHYFQHKTGGTVVKFFVVKSSDGIIRAAFDACDVCYPAKKGYSQDGDFMVCNNCGRRFHSTRINVVQGGCNPAPLKREVVAEDLVIRVDDVIPGARFF